MNEIDLRNSNSIWVGFPGGQEKSWNISSTSIQPAMKEWSGCMRIMVDTAAKVTVPTPPPAMQPTNGKGNL